MLTPSRADSLPLSTGVHRAKVGASLLAMAYKRAAQFKCHIITYTGDVKRWGMRRCPSLREVIIHDVQILTWLPSRQSLQRRCRRHCYCVIEVESSLWKAEAMD